MVNVLKIISNLSYDELNQILMHIRDTYYYYHEKNLYFIGSKDSVVNALRENFVCFEEMEPRPLSFSGNDINILRVLIYKAFRSFLTRKGFAWDPRKRNEVFIACPNPKLEAEVYKIYRVKLISSIVGENLNILRVHEGFRYKLDIIDGVPALTLFPKVTPLIKAPNNPVEMDVIFTCYIPCPWKGKRQCRLPRKKVKVLKTEHLNKEYIFCPENVSRSLVKLIDNRRRVYEVPEHVIHIEAHPTAIKALGSEAYKEFRRLSLKRTSYRLRTLMALLYYISEGNNTIKIPVGDDPEGIVINSIPSIQTIIDKSEVWKEYRTS
ncbi:MAG: hypothetical protein DRN04_13605 [Thermoprotei archaeon]|nr:MAG: hypothetical protein DRN04_13605 [Thermoprotei archaeon]